MVLRAGLVFVLVLGATWASDARDSQHAFPDDLVLQINHQKFDGQDKVLEEMSVGKNLCAMCEELTMEVLDYLEDNSTQNQIIDILYQTCSELHPIKKQCTTLVDYYVPLVFTEISSVQPKLFCEYIDLCEEEAIITMKKSDEKCTACQHVIEEVLVKLKDPDTEVCCGALALRSTKANFKNKNNHKFDRAARNFLSRQNEQTLEKLEIIELLLKACNDAEGRKNVQKCKTLIFKYGPLILENAPQILQKLNLCKAIHACKSSPSSSNQEYLHSAS